ncbi:hypothetical protein RN001_010950 [Aquatica leii]|uniref:Proline-rich transmembrane protein 3/4 domain-containing protein n=1 Tax=Aquatica leii TaxID=1421715 RepID=A0AAN7SGE1_9COLE|nr:hypothetical protein RN001_010950 [Aquatica leii]
MCGFKKCKWKMCDEEKRNNGADDNFFSDLIICDSTTNSCKSDLFRTLPRPNSKLILLTRMCLYLHLSPFSNLKLWKILFMFLIMYCPLIGAYPNDKTEKLIDKINLEQSIAAVFNKVAYGSTTKRSIPDNSYPVTTLATPLLTTYRYSDGSDEWLRVDVKSSDGNSEYDDEDNRNNGDGYGMDLEKDHGLPTSAPAADILKNNNNRNYNNPNRYNNDRLRPDYDLGRFPEQVTENLYKTTTNYNILRNVRPTKSIFSKDIPSYVPPNKALFTPPLPDKFIHPFADKPTLRGTNSDSFVNKRPFPRPSLLTPNKDQIPYRPDLSPSKPINVERVDPQDTRNERKKTLNTPSQNVNIGEFYGLNRNLNETNFEYEKGYIPSITRILSGSNGRHDEIPDILLKTVTDSTLIHRIEPKTKARPPVTENVRGSTKMQDFHEDTVEENKRDAAVVENKPPDKPEGVTSRKAIVEKDETTTQNSDVLNLPNIKTKDANVTKADSDKIWLICWNVHVYLVVFLYILLAIFSIFKLIRYENDPHMFSKSYFLTVHLMLTVISVLRIFYLTYDPYNVGKSFNIFLYEFLHNFPLSLLATTFAILILFLLKRTLNHLKVKTRPVFLVVFAVMHICMCFCLSVVETLGHFDRASLIVCKPVFVLLTWALGFSYLYLYKIIKNVLAKKTQNLSEMCTQNISYASHITIAVALLFVLLGFVQLYSLFFIKVDRFTEIKHHWILWGFELSVRVLEIAIITLLAIVVSLKMSQREKQTVGFPLFPCTTSDSSTDNIFPNNCTTNPNALNYSRNEMIMDSIPSESVDRPNLLKNAFQNDSFDKKSTLERCRQSDNEAGSFDRFERPKWGSERFEVDRVRQNVEQTSLNSFGRGHNNERNSGRKTYESAKYYTKPKYDLEYNNEDYQQDPDANVYSEPIDNQYDRRGPDFERSDFERRSKNSTNTSGRRSTGRTRKNHARPHLGVQTLPGHDIRHQIPDTMLVDDQGFVRFRHLQDVDQEKPKKAKRQNEVNHYSDT